MIIKNKLIVLLIALSAFISASAQIKKNGWYYIPLPMVDSAEWCVVSQDGRHQQPEWRSFRYYKTKGDTFMSGQTYKKLWTNTHHHKYYATDTLVCMYRQDTTARKVYVRSAYNYYADTNEYLVMDFGVKTNDTIVLPIFTRNGNYEQRKFYVGNVDSQKLVIPGPPLKVYYDRLFYGVVCIDTSELVYGDMWHPLRDYGFFEGIGNDKSVSPFFYPIARKEYYYQTDVTSRLVDTVVYLHCLESPDSVIWIFKSNPQLDYCSNILSITPVDYKTQSLIMFPNPCNEYIDVNFETIIPEMQLEIIDMTGKRVDASSKKVGSNIERISTINLTPGVFILHAYNNYGFNESYKIIKQ